MKAQHKFAWQSGDLEPGWLPLISERDRSHLLALLCTAGRSREEKARGMLSAPPWPSDESDAAARCAEVIEVLDLGP